MDVLVIPDPHAHPEFNNDRADWLGKFILDRKPDTVVNMGDTWDFPSLSSYDKGKAEFVSRSYEKDVEAGIEFNDRLFHPIKKAKRRKPKSYFLIGNHEHRIAKVLQYDPQLSGEKYGISFSNLQLSKYYDKIIPYDGGTPGTLFIGDVSFAHYFVSGLMGRPISGEHHAYSLLAKNYSSCVAAHSHTVDWAVRTDAKGNKIMGLVAGVYQDYRSPWAGAANELWWKGCVYLKDLSGGTFTPEFISIEELRREYG